MEEIIKKLIKQNDKVYRLFRCAYYPIRKVKEHKYVKKYGEEGLRKIDRTGKKTIYYFGVPVHKNLGDFAQTYCILQYFKKYWQDYSVVSLQTYGTYYRKFLKKMKRNINPNDIIFFQSGYCTTDYHLDHTMHKIIVKNFPNNEIVFLPQTVLFRNEKEKKKTADIFSSHDHILFLARDAVSYKNAKDMFKGIKVKLFPDIVTTMIGTFGKACPEKDILFCVRNDSEKLVSDNEFDKLFKNFSSEGLSVEVTDTSCYELDYSYIISNLDNVICKKIEEFRKYRLVVTDRYHGTIFSMIANVPVIVLPTKDHKVVTGLDWFIGRYDNACYGVESIDEVFELGMRIINSETNISNEPYFEKEYYSGLRKLVEL